MYGLNKQADDQHNYGRREEDPPAYGAKTAWLQVMGRAQAEQQLLRSGMAARGHFLVRESESRKGQYAISVVGVAVVHFFRSYSCGVLFFRHCSHLDVPAGTQQHRSGASFSSCWLGWQISSQWY